MTVWMKLACDHATKLQSTKLTLNSFQKKEFQNLTYTSQAQDNTAMKDLPWDRVYFWSDSLSEPEEALAFFWSSLSSSE